MSLIQKKKNPNADVTEEGLRANNRKEAIEKFRNGIYEFEYVKLGGTWDKHKNNDGGFVLQWAANGIGFGELSFIKKDGKTECHTECMSRKFIDAALKYFLDNIDMLDI
jgi:hypothetical protein